MDRKIALQWARALESGEYPQTTGALRDKNGFCCLGVLCNLHAQAHPEIAAQQEDPYEYMGETGSLPEDVMDWAGIRSMDDDFLNDWGAERKLMLKVKEDTNEKEEVDGLIALNDEFNFDFKKIAAVIRSHSDKL